MVEIKLVRCSFWVRDKCVRSAPTIFQWAPATIISAPNVNRQQ